MQSRISSLNRDLSTRPILQPVTFRWSRPVRRSRRRTRVTFAVRGTGRPVILTAHGEGGALDRSGAGVVLHAEPERRYGKARGRGTQGSCVPHGPRYYSQKPRPREASATC
jgi:hypothetical protein